MPTCENRRSTAADVAEQPRYWRAMTARLGNSASHVRCCGHQSRRLIKSGVKPTASADLWSDNGMGLFGIFADGITETWVVEKKLIGLVFVACESERHTAQRTSASVDQGGT